MKRKVIAEIGSCNGDLGLAVDTAQAALEAGAWKVKGQMFQADTLVTRTAPTYGKDSIQECDTQYEAFERALTYAEWEQVAAAVDGQFFASVFDLEAVRDYPYEWIKIASADIRYRRLIETAAATGAHLIVSTGAATLREVSDALSWIPGTNRVLLACTLSYPTEPIDAHVRRITTLRDLGAVVGYSDHTRGTNAAHLAFDLGATMVEKHFTIRPGTGGDHDFAIGPQELSEIVSRKDPVSEAVEVVYGGSPVIGPRMPEMQARILARRSLRAAVDIPLGTVVTLEMIDVIRPGEGMDPALLDSPKGPLGRHTVRTLAAGDPFTADALYR